jgi:preprotein translocase subunit SecF
MSDIGDELNKSLEELKKKYEDELSHIKSEFNKNEKEARKSVLKELREEEEKKLSDKNKTKEKQKEKKKKERKKRKEKVINFFNFIMSKLKQVNRKYYILFFIIILVLALLYLGYRYEWLEYLKNLILNKNSPVPNTV